MSNLRRYFEEITIENKEYIMAFDMKSVDIFNDINEKGLLKSLPSLNKLEDKTVLNFIASTLRDKSDPNTPLGEKIFDGRFDLFYLLIALTPTMLKIVREGFPQQSNSKKKLEQKK